MVPIRKLVFGMVAGCTLFTFLSFTQTRQADNDSFFLDRGSPTDHQWLTRMPELTKGLQFTEQRLFNLEVQIKELGRSHSTNSGLLLWPPLIFASGRSSADTALGSYKILATSFARATASLPTEGGHVAQNAIDNDVSTRVACSKGCAWTGDLGNLMTLVSISIDWESCDCQDATAVKIEIAFVDSGPWQLYSNAGGFYTSGGHTQRSHVMMAEARYIRISSTGSYSIWEVYARIETQSLANLEPAPSFLEPGETTKDTPTNVVKDSIHSPPSPPPTPSQLEATSAGASYRPDSKCGKRVEPLATGGPVQCNALGTFPCCSALGWCGNTEEHCNCPDCVDYRKNVQPNALPTLQPNALPTLPKTEDSSEIAVAVIIPFRDRETHLTMFKPFWRWFAKEGIQPKKVRKWAIYIVEQFDAMGFNRGWNFNVGLAVASKQTSACQDITEEMTVPFRCAAIQDIDYLPEAGVDYSECSVPMQLSAEIDRYNWKTPYLESAGGIVSMNLGHWQQVNGFGNDYFGWGGEDDELHHRLRLTGLLYGDCYPFCQPDDPNKGKTGKSIKRPPKGNGRFSGKYMHSANHTKRITDHRAYKNNNKMLHEIRTGQPRWKRDGLSNLAFRIVSYEKDTADAEEHGITYHHVKVRRGRDPYDPRRISIAVPTSVCGLQTEQTSWHMVTLGEPIPWTLASLRTRVGNVLKEHCTPPWNWNARSFILVDRRYYLVKLLSDDNAAMLVAFYRGLADPKEDGLIIVDPRSPEQIRQAFEAATARIHPPTEYTICTSKLGNLLKYSLHQGPACAGGWDKIEAGTFWAFTEKKADMKAVSFCDNSRYWVQRIRDAIECEKKWQGLKWAHGGTFWVPAGKQFCVGSKTGGEVPFSQALPKEDCNSNGFEHEFTFGSVNYAHTFGAFTLCVGRKGGALRLTVDRECDADGHSKELRFRARTHSAAASTDEEFCITETGDGFSKNCEGKNMLKFNVPAESVSGDYRVLCSGASVQDPSSNMIGLDEQCNEGPARTLNKQAHFKVPSLLDIAAAVPMGVTHTGKRDGQPFYTLVDEDRPCMGMFCESVTACAEGQAKDAIDKPCVVTVSVAS